MLPIRSLRGGGAREGGGRVRASGSGAFDGTCALWARARLLPGWVQQCGSAPLFLLQEAAAGGSSRSSRERPSPPAPSQPSQPSGTQPARHPRVVDGVRAGGQLGAHVAVGGAHAVLVAVLEAREGAGVLRAGVPDLVALVHVDVAPVADGDLLQQGRHLPGAGAQHRGLSGGWARRCTAARRGAPGPGDRQLAPRCGCLSPGSLARGAAQRPAHLLEGLHVGVVQAHLLEREGLDGVVAAKGDAAVLLHHRLLVAVALDVAAGQVHLRGGGRGSAAGAGRAAAAAGSGERRPGRQLRRGARTSVTCADTV